METKTQKQIVLCNSNLSSCFCHEKKGHDGLHKCRCGGSWDDNFEPHSLPDISGGFGSFPLMEWEEDELKKETIIDSFEQGVTPTK